MNNVNNMRYFILDENSRNVKNLLLNDLLQLLLLTDTTFAMNCIPNKHIVRQKNKY